MARDKTEIYQQMVDETGAEPLLNSWYQNPSKTAIWRLWLWVVASGVYLLELIFDQFKTDVDTLAKAAQVGNAPWYRSRIFEFQYTDSLVLVGDKYQYTAIDETKKIVKRCAIEEKTNGKLRVKVAKLTGQNLVALDNSETQALISYLKKVRFAGVLFEIFSNNGDQLKINFQIYFDPIKPQSIIQPLAEKTIKDFVSNLPFDGELVVTKLIDDLQKIEGINDVIFTGGASRFSVLDAYQPIVRAVVAVGGYFTISTQSGETLADTITYINN